MKTLIIFLSVVVIAFVLFVSIRSTTGIDVPEKVKAEFAKLYPHVKNVEWHTTPESNYEGRFNYKNKERAVQISVNGKLVLKATYLKESELPKPIQEYIKKNYSTNTFNYYEEVITAKNVKRYQAESADKVLFFDSTGKIIKVVNNSDKDHGTVKLDGD